jgi:DNA processing protein
VTSDPALLARFARAPALDAQGLIAALRAFGSLEALAAASVVALVEAGLDPRAAQSLHRGDDRAIATDVAAIQRHGFTLLHAGDPRYPPLLAGHAGMPAVLWVQGDAAALSTPQLAMVGSRHPTALGASTARQFAAWFARAGVTITSGLARGIDAACHEAALSAGGLTIAVCGGGLDRIYPPEHALLAARIAASGALISEFPPGTPPLRHQFPRRNRLIAGLALGTLVVEARQQSGSLITARHAAELGREVFAIPGSIHSMLSRGCHRLIRDGAMLVEDAAEVLSVLKIPILNQSVKCSFGESARPPATTRRLDKDYEILLDALGSGPTGIDDLVARTGLPSESVASMLLILELEGEITTESGGRYSRHPDTTDTP